MAFSLPTHVAKHHARATLRVTLACLPFCLPLLLLLALGGPAAAQVNTNRPVPPAGMVRLNLQGETELTTLIDYVSQRLNIQFLYSTNLSERTVNLRAPREIPVSSLLPLLSSALKMENLAIVDDTVPGFKRIVDIREAPKVAVPGNAQEVLEKDGAAAPVTQAFVLQYIGADDMVALVRPLLTLSGGTSAGGQPSITAVAQTNMLVVTDYAPTVVTVERLIKLIDQPRGLVEFETYTVQHLEASALAEQIRALLLPRISPPGNRPRTPNREPGTADLTSPINLLPNQRTNQIVIVGPRMLVDEALELARRFDVSLGRTTKVVRLDYVKAERFDRLVKGFLAEQDSSRLYSATVDEEGNLLIVRATEEIHARIEELAEQLDVPVEAGDSPIRFYKLKNANAADVLFTLRSLQELTTGSVGGITGGTLLGNPLQSGLLYPGLNPFGLQQGTLGGELPGTLDRVPGPSSAMRAQGATSQPLQLPLEPDAGPMGAYEQTQQARTDRLNSLGLANPFGGIGGLGLGSVASLPGGARVSADITTNSIVVYATPDIQPMYAKLIESLDRRRPQVLIEAEIVAVDTTDTVRVGVEVSTGDRTGSGRLFEFTSFGLSEINPDTGALRIRPALGFNGTMVNADIADFVVQALAAHTKAEVLAAPRILVNDNVPGTLESVVKVPFQSVNASQTVSTTSLGGFTDAGTTITVTPHINQDEHLLLEFAVEFSTFNGDGNANLPPPRQVDRIESTVTIPDGHTVIVGGLRRISDTNSMTGVPFVEKIPVLRELSSLTDNRHTTTSFFLFIRPIILRDDKFADLRFVSDKSLRANKRPGQFPASEPLLIE